MNPFNQQLEQAYNPQRMFRRSLLVYAAETLASELLVFLDAEDADFAKRMAPPHTGRAADSRIYQSTIAGHYRERFRAVVNTMKTAFEDELNINISNNARHFGTFNPDFNESNDNRSMVKQIADTLLDYANQLNAPKFA